jgi:hypothetical protein
VAVTIDGEQVAARDVSLDGGAVTTLEIELPTDLSSGTHQLALEEVEGGAVSFVVLTPADISSGAVSLSQDVVNAGGPVEAIVTLDNDGEVDGTYEVALCVDGEQVCSTEETVEGEGSSRVTLPFTVDAPGLHEIDVDGHTTELKVCQLDRLASGTVLVNTMKGGEGQLRIENEYPQDCVVIMTPVGQPDTPVLALYIRGTATESIGGIKDGTYDVYAAHGDEWCTHFKEFTSNAELFKWEEPSTFDTRYTSRYVHYQILTLTFGAPMSGEAGDNQTVHVGDSEFPGL